MLSALLVFVVYAGVVALTGNVAAGTVVAGALLAAPFVAEFVRVKNEKEKKKAETAQPPTEAPKRPVEGWGWAEISTDATAASGFRLSVSAQRYSSQKDAVAALARHLDQHSASDPSYALGADRLRSASERYDWYWPREVCAPPRRWLVSDRPFSQMFVVDRGGVVRRISFPLVAA
ncbi:hypothetical protein ACWIGI_34665 [Nocardia sp. NPDC055321]